MDNNKIAFVVPPFVELLDLAGPVQTFKDAQDYGLECSIEFYSFQPDIISTAGIGFGKITDYRQAQLSEGDFLLIPGMNFEYLSGDKFKMEKEFIQWVREMAKKKVTVCSICNGAFVLGQAGLLDNQTCTTHWRRVSELRRQFPASHVIDEVYFVKSGNIYTSAGVSAGIDMALGIIKDLRGPLFAAEVAKEIVYNMREPERSKQ